MEIPNLIKHKMADIKPQLESINWNEFKRIPQVLKRKSKIGCYTVDEKFDSLHGSLVRLEGDIRRLVKFSSVFVNETNKVVDLSSSIGESFRSLLDPYNNFTRSNRDALKRKPIGTVSEEIFNNELEKELFTKEYKFWDICNEYIERNKDIKTSIGDLRNIISIIDLKCKTCLTIIENVKIQARGRNNELDDLDFIKNSLDSLDVKSRTQQLTAKESQLQFHLERKYEQKKMQYNHINELFKKELPLLFKLTKKFLMLINYIMYFTQLLIVYQVSSNLTCFENILKFKLQDIQHFSWNNEIITVSSKIYQQAQESIESLDILNLQDNYYTEATDVRFTKQFQELAVNQQTLINFPLETIYEVNLSNLYNIYCRALFGYVAQQPGDLTFEVDDVIQVLKQDGEWWEGKVEDKCGMFPSNYVKLI